MEFIKLFINDFNNFSQCMLPETQTTLHCSSIYIILATLKYWIWKINALYLTRNNVRIFMYTEWMCKIIVRKYSVSTWILTSLIYKGWMMIIPVNSAFTQNRMFQNFSAWKDNIEIAILNISKFRIFILYFWSYL